jgi:hypothetical protein
MGRLGTFLLGFLLGGATVFTSLHYHLIRATDGFHLVPKVQSTFAESYVDIRGFGYDDWMEHRALALAIVQADKGHLIEGIGTQLFEDALSGLGKMLHNKPEG